MNAARKYAARCPKAGTFLQVPAQGKKPPVLVPLGEARLYPDLAAARKAAEPWGGEAVAVDLVVNPAAQTFTTDGGRFLFARNGASCPPPAWWADVPTEGRLAALAATGWVPA